MADGDEDADLKFAIALSLQSNPEHSDFQVEQADISDDDDLRLAIQLSLQQEGATSPQCICPEIPHINSRAPQPILLKGFTNIIQATSGSSGSQNITSPGSLVIQRTPDNMLGLDRKKMEEERLARVAQRPKRSIGDVNEANNSREVKKRARTENASVASYRQKGAPTIGFNNVNHHPTLQYPYGTVKKTWAKGFERNNDIKIEEVFLRDHLKIAVLSSFMWDPEWFSSKINTAYTKMVLVVFAKTDAEKQGWKEDAAAAGQGKMRVCFPPMEGETNCLHSKLMVLFYPDSMRIVVPTANLVPYDWGETGTMENTVFLIDLPRLPDGRKLDRKDLTFFGEELFYFLEKSQMQDMVLDGMLKFDFSATERLAFVHSVGGASFGDDLHRTGFNGLASAIHRLKLSIPASQLELEYASASLGALSDDYLSLIHRSATGEMTSTGTRTKQKSNANVRDRFRVYFPTANTVETSLGGMDHAGTICLREEWYKKQTFPKDVMRDHVSKRRGLLSHSKIILGHASTQRLAWAYVGSANLSESAWGKVVNDRVRRENKLVCRNWESGVVIPVDASGQQFVAQSEFGGAPVNPLPLNNVFESVLDVPFVVPSRPYDNATPWFFRYQGY